MLILSCHDYCGTDRLKSSAKSSMRHSGTFSQWWVDQKPLPSSITFTFHTQVVNRRLWCAKNCMVIYTKRLAQMKDNYYTKPHYFNTNIFFSNFSLKIKMSSVSKTPIKIHHTWNWLYWIRSKAIWIILPTNRWLTTGNYHRITIFCRRKFHFWIW